MPATRSNKKARPQGPDFLLVRVFITDQRFRSCFFFASYSSCVTIPSSNSCLYFLNSSALLLLTCWITVLELLLWRSTRSLLIVLCASSLSPILANAIFPDDEAMMILLRNQDDATAEMESRGISTRFPNSAMP